MYLSLLSGQLVVAGGLSAGDEATDPSRYFRLASFVSALGFVAGYSPEFFGILLDRMIRGPAATSSSAGEQAGKTQGVSPEQVGSNQDSS